ncbi:MAG: hypothetical protein PHU27_04840 [Salinivirgaceae bacterium]|nr:hypothetical protein [Salinivirgaceae bacterium]MDD4747067.1 hypothetical protein [Salinivirgaceae bacterium]MDY0280291.1 hypothetical protein [Salinivirgaceae bacterium]
MRLSYILVITLSVSILCSCGGDQSKKLEKSLTNEDSENTDKLKRDFNKAKQIFYSLPSPIETAMLIRRAGVDFDETLLNKTENYSNYTTSLKKALNLGIYSADLSYASMFEQTQIAIKYMSITKLMAQDIGILSAIDERVLRRLETNINNRDSIMDIISESFMNSDSYLKENGRPETAAIILAGGWIEGLYLAVKSSGGKKGNDDLVDRIIDQKISLGSLLQLLESYHNIEMVSRVLVDVKKIEKIYENFDIVYSHIETLTDPEDRSTVLKARTEVFKSANALKSLSHLVDSLRTSYVQ